MDKMTSVWTKYKENQGHNNMYLLTEFGRGWLAGCGRSVRHNLEPFQPNSVDKHFLLFDLYVLKIWTQIGRDRRAHAATRAQKNSVMKTFLFFFFMSEQETPNSL